MITILSNWQPIRNYSDIKNLSTRGFLRGVALSFLAASYKLSGRLDSSLTRNRVQFLYFHHVFKDEEEPFRKLLSMLSKTHRFLSYSDAVDKILNGKIDAPYLCFSFDDGFKNCVRAANILKDYGVKGCFFLCTSIIDETEPEKIKRYCSEVLHLPPVEFLSWKDAEYLVKEGHEIGSHTVSHANLGKVSNQEVQDEIINSYDLLKERIGKTKHFSWPYGRFSHFNRLAAEAVFEAGFTSCASAERGCHIAVGQLERKQLCIRRDLVVCQWHSSHILYFLARNSLVASTENNTWPKEWNS